MTQFYSHPDRANDPFALPDIEVFYIDSRDSFDGSFSDGPGWYWWACFPGCLPDSDPVGPFTSEAEASTDAEWEWRD